MFKVRVVPRNKERTLIYIVFLLWFLFRLLNAFLSFNTCKDDKWKITMDVCVCVCKEGVGSWALKWVLYIFFVLKRNSFLACICVFVPILDNFTLFSSI